MDYIVEVGISSRMSDNAADIFDIHDFNYYVGDVRKQPPDFNLHLAIYLLEHESLPSSILDQVKQWAKDNPVAGFHYERIMQPVNSHVKG